MVSEYHALRMSVVGQWLGQVSDGAAFEADDMTRFNDAIQQRCAPD